MTRPFPLSKWFAARDPEALLRVAWPRGTPANTPAHQRRARLYGIACARQVWEFLPTDARSAVLISERLADGRADEGDLRAAAVVVDYGAYSYQQEARNAAGWASGGFRGHELLATPQWEPAEAAREAAKALATRAAGRVPGGRLVPPEWHATWNAVFVAARADQAEFIRDIFPPPGFAPELDPRWLTSTVRELAAGMDASGDFSPVPILADALQDAGCEVEPILDRCRAPGPHVRGNWVVDLVLGRVPPVELPPGTV